MCFFFVIGSSIQNDSSVFAPALYICLLRPPRRFTLIAYEQTLPPETRVAGVLEDEESGFLPPAGPRFWPPPTIWATVDRRPLRVSGAALGNPTGSPFEDPMWNYLKMALG
jgi:hypothetical protein